MASDNKTNAELSRSGVYRLNNSSGVLGNSYGAQLEYMNSKTGENPTDNVRDIGASKSKTNLNASKISISHENKESSDYHADESSVTADYDTQRGEMPQWRKLLLDPEKAGYFLSRQWPRISLRASFRSKEPYVVPNEDDKDSSAKEKIPLRNKRTVCVILSCAVLVLLAIIPTVVITLLARNDDASNGKSYAKVSMEITISSTFKEAFQNFQSTEYGIFVTEFCQEIGKVYSNGTLDNYYGCRVTNLTRGSVVVAFVLYFKEVKLQNVTKQGIEKQLLDYVKSTYSLGAFLIVNNSIHVIDVVIEILTTPPQVQNTKIDASSTSSKMATSFYKETFSVISVFNITEASSVFYTHTAVLNSSFKSNFISITTPTLTTDKSSLETRKSDMFNDVSVHSSNILENTHFTKELISFSVSLLTSISDSISVNQQTTLTHSLAANSTRNIIETASKLTTLTFNELSDYSTTDVSKTTNGASTSRDFVNYLALTPLMSTSSFQSLTTDLTLLVPESNKDSYTTGIKISTNVSPSITTVANTSVPLGIPFPSTADKDTSNFTTISVTATTSLTDSSPFDVSKITKSTSTSRDFSMNTSFSSLMSTSYLISSITEGIPSSSSSFYITAVSNFNTNGITRSLADIYSDSVKDEPLSCYSSQVLSRTPATSTATSNILLTSRVSPLYNEDELRSDLTYFISSSVLHDTTSYSESFQITASPIETSKKLSDYTTDPSEIKISTAKSISESISPINRTIMTTKSTLIIDSWTNNSLSMPRTLSMSPSQSNYKTPTITVITNSDMQSTIMSTSTDFNNTMDILATVASSMLATVSSTLSTGNIQSTRSSVLESTSSVLTTETPNQDLINCTNVTTEMYKGPVTMICTVDIRSNFDKISISHGPADQLLYSVELFTNGTKHVLKSDSNINSNFNVSKVEITFKNVSCHMSGDYNLHLVKSVNYSLSWTTGHLLVLSQPEIPTLTLNEDQVINLVFPSGYFYRSESKHVCEGNIGNPPVNLVVDIMYANGTKFENIPSDSYNESRSLMNSFCSSYERIEFAIKFSVRMEGARLRCRVPGAFEHSTEKTLTLIPRNFCDCASPSSNYEHPARCDAYVKCIQDQNIMYPFGALCRSAGLCSSNTIGICSHNCSSTCIKTKPPDLCIPPTRTPAPSPYISCNESMTVMLYIKPPAITCTLNQTSSFESIDITKISGNSMVEIARILSNGTVIQRITDNNLNVSFAIGIITISLTNVTCTDEGVYKVDLNKSGVMASAQTQFSVIKRPNGNATLRLHPDQIADLGFYRKGNEHSCKADIGSSSAEIKVEILKKGETKFSLLNVTVASISNVPINCSVTSEMKFGINFSSDMFEAIIRCRIESNMYDDPIYSNNETLSLISSNFCDCASPSIIYEHPSRCDAFVQCLEYEKIMYPFGVLCRNTGLCSSSTIGICSQNCSSTCIKTKPKDICIPPTTTPAPSPYISCNESMTVFLYSKPPVITCTLNQTSVFESINITKLSGNTITEISRISSNGTVIQRITNNNLYVTFSMGIITISLINVTCSDESVYKVDLNKSGVMASAQTQLSVVQRPNGNATLWLHPDQIADLGFYRKGNEHSCKTDIGSSFAEIKVEILKKGETKFSFLNVTVVSITNVTTNCSITQEMKFGINFSSDMFEAIIRCRIESNMFSTDHTIYSNNETLSLISNHFCDNKLSASYPHPTDCNKYVTCTDNTLFGRACLPNLCFNSSINNCDYCYNVICHTPSSTAESTTVYSITTTKENPSMSDINMNCTQLSDFIGSGPVYIRCTFQLSSSLKNINISKTLNSTDHLLATVNSDGIVNMVQLMNGLQINYTKTHVSTILLNIYTISCSDEATYNFVATQDNATFVGRETLIAKSKPGTPTLTLSHQTVLNKKNGDSVCRANVGNPKGTLQILVKRENEADYTKYAEFTETIKETKMDCNTNSELKFSLNFTSQWNNTNVKCQVQNDQAIDVNENLDAYTSNVDTVVLLPDDYCFGFSGFKKHPRNDCAYFIQCGNGTIFSWNCGRNSCFNGARKYCDFCYNVNNATCNFP